MSDNDQRNQERRKPWMPLVKWITTRRDRAMTKQALHHEDYDKLSNSERLHEEDPWYYD